METLLPVIIVSLRSPLGIELCMAPVFLKNPPTFFRNFVFDYRLVAPRGLLTDLGRLPIPPRFCIYIQYSASRRIIKSIGTNVERFHRIIYAGERYLCDLFKGVDGRSLKQLLYNVYLKE